MLTATSPERRSIVGRALMYTLIASPSWSTQCFYAFARMGLSLAGLADECDEAVPDEELSSPRY